MIDTNTLNDLWNRWQDSECSERFGQFVVNRVAGLSIEYLFYEEDDHKAYDHIAEYIYLISDTEF